MAKNEVKKRFPIWVWALIIVGILILVILFLVYPNYYIPNKELIMYGSSYAELKNQESVKNFVNEEITKYGNEENASRHHLRKGFSELRQNKIDHATIRFNQAWIISPHEPKSFIGLALVSYKNGDVQTSLKMLKEAQVLFSNNDANICDIFSFKESLDGYESLTNFALIECKNLTTVLLTPTVKN